MENICAFNLVMYPFDKQECSIILKNKGKEGDSIQLTPKNLSYFGPTSLGDYDIEEPEYVDASTENAIMIKVKFSRNVWNELLNTLMPSFLLAMVGISSF